MLDTATLTTLVEHLGLIVYPLILVFSLGESTGLTIFCGILIHIGILNPFLSYGSILAGAILADDFYYRKGRRHGRKILSHGGILGRWIDRTLTWINRRFKGWRWILKLVCFKSPFLYGVGTIGLMGMGAERFPSRAKFLAACVTIEMFEIVIYLLIGGWNGSGKEDHVLGMFPCGVACVVALILVYESFSWLQRMLRRLINESEGVAADD